MTSIDRKDIEKLVRAIISQEYGNTAETNRTVDKSGVMAIKLPLFNVTEEDRLETNNPKDRVYTKDLMSLEESPRLGLGLMVMEETTFDWHLSYDEIDYIIEGSLSIIIDGRKVTANPGEILFIPKDTDIKFSVEGKARFIYVTYPADWQG